MSIRTYTLVMKQEFASYLRIEAETDEELKMKLVEFLTDDDHYKAMKWEGVDGTLEFEDIWENGSIPKLSPETMKLMIDGMKAFKRLKADVKERVKAKNENIGEMLKDEMDDKDHN